METVSNFLSWCPIFHRMKTNEAGYQNTKKWTQFNFFFFSVLYVQYYFKGGGSGINWLLWGQWHLSYNNAPTVSRVPYVFKFIPYFYFYSTIKCFN